MFARNQAKLDLYSEPSMDPGVLAQSLLARYRQVADTPVDLTSEKQAHFFEIMDKINLKNFVVQPQE